MVSAADCRLMAFESVEQSQQFWIKVTTCWYNYVVLFPQHVFCRSSRSLTARICFSKLASAALTPCNQSTATFQGRLFSVAGLLASEKLGNMYKEASMLIFRLAPQGVFNLCCMGRVICRHIIHMLHNGLHLCGYLLTTLHGGSRPYQSVILPCRLPPISQPCLRNYRVRISDPSRRLHRRRQYNLSIL
jgi:hypothetical protein